MKSTHVYHAANYLEKFDDFIGGFHFLPTIIILAK